MCRVFGNLTCTISSYAGMPMGMDQVLTRNKTDQQEPGMNNMIFMPFQSCKRPRLISNKGK